MSPAADTKSGAIVLHCWERIFQETDQGKNACKAFVSVMSYFETRSQELRIDRYGHISKSVKRIMPNALTRAIRFIAKKKASKTEEAAELVYSTLRKRVRGQPSLEDRYAIFYDARQLDSPDSQFRRWGDCWKAALNFYFKHTDDKSNALKNGIIIGYNPQANPEHRTVHLRFLGKRTRHNLAIEELKYDVSTSSEGLAKFLKATLDLIKPRLWESESYLTHYKTRNISAALTFSILLSLPFIIIGYLLDLLFWPLPAATGISRLAWKFFEIVIRYLQGSMDSIIQFYEIKKVFKVEKRYGKLKGEGLDEYKAARLGGSRIIYRPHHHHSCAFGWHS